VPGFPLDGGRIRRAALWAVTGNLVRATRWASGAGQAFAWLLILAGIGMMFGARLPFFGSGPFAGMWLVFIGLFLNGAARASYQHVVVEGLLAGIPVSRLMRTEVPSATPATSLESLVDDYLLKTDERAFPVLEGDELAGLVCLEDVRKVPRDRWPSTTFAEVMTPADRLATVTPGQEASEALHELSRRDVRQLPVVEGQQLVGMLRRRDLVRWLQLRTEPSVSERRAA
jgi:CBS domain-containing protein